MEQVYTLPGHSAAYSGRNQLSRHFPKENAKGFLSSIDSYTRHRFAKNPRYRNPIYVYDTLELIQVDLAEVRSLAQWNNNINYLLLCLDTFSRKAFVRPLPNKSAPVVASAMKNILDEIGKPVKRLLSDNGSEFKNVKFKTLLQQYDILHSFSTAEVKAPHVERFCGTLKRLMHMHMTERERRIYIDQLDNLLNSYNSRWHRAIEMSPNEAFQPENREKVLAVLNRKRYGPVAMKRSRKDPEFKVGDVVRLKVHHKSAFKKGHDETFTGEFFKIHSVIDTLPITQYEVTNYNGDEVVRGRFYSSELQLSTNPLFKVENVIRRRKGKNGKQQLYVKWLHFGEEHNEWINESDVGDFFDNDNDG